ncbi:glycosyltransferase [uncultured Sphingomonas sp.]|uniref:glycosyltransferase n=1 Tax=uncultured Sphingomonas sp. TaxID=158754 RepID=UPI0035C965A1
MRVLFTHQNFPAQYKHLAPALHARGDEVAALTMNEPPAGSPFPVLRSASRHGTSATHPWARDFETKVIRAEATLQTAVKLRAEGFQPDVIVAHPGWGDTLFLKQVWPEARLGVYCEYFYRSEGGDLDFDPEFGGASDPLEAVCRFRLRNLTQRLNLEVATAAISPTRFQAGTYPKRFQHLIDVVFDGIDTSEVRPDASTRMRVAGVELKAGDEVITFVARNLEPYRGYHIFMRALPELLRRRPGARVVIVGGDGVSYGAAAPTGSWREIFLGEVADRVDRSRVHFLGSIPYPTFLSLLRVSALHVYLTYPFVLSWSLMEAMATGVPILASDTAPVREVVADGETGALFPFFDPAALADRACELLADADMRRRLAANGRALIDDRYDLRRVCLPRQIAWIDRLAAADPIIPETD